MGWTVIMSRTSALIPSASSFSAAFSASRTVLEIAELPYRLGIRSALFLGRSTKEQEVIREVMRVAYKARNMAVHGKEQTKLKLNGEAIKLEELVDKVESYLRKSVAGFVSLSQYYGSQEEVIKELEKSVTNSDSRSQLLARTGFLHEA